MSIKDPAGRHSGDVSIANNAGATAAGRNWGETVVTIVLATVAVLAVSLVAVMIGLA